MRVEDPIERSRIMRSVKSKHTTPELIVRRFLHAHGFRFRLHSTDLPGKPDIVMRARKLVVRVMGCYWHGHSCKRGNRLPKTNMEYWVTKISRNVERDKRSKAALKKMGWHVIDIWECELQNQSWESKLLRKIGMHSK